VADVVPDVVAIADKLELPRFAVLGRSGGGPHALACAALLPERVTRAGVLMSMALWAAEGLDWFAGMAESNVRQHTAAASQPELLTASTPAGWPTTFPARSWQSGRDRAPRRP
jgi:pimeloyl-ACP methyl ester carboxylesterase